MVQNQFHNLIRRLRSASCNTQGTILREISCALSNVNEDDLHELFELINITHDIELQVKLFSVLAAYLVTNDTNTDIIVTYKPLYDRLQEVLSSGLPMKTTITLNFISALLSIHDEDTSTKHNTLAVFVRDMIRVSGCLSTMSNMFLSCLMYHDTWIALCQCLGNACRGSEVNQSYCAHLIPLCVQKCLQGCTDVCQLLESLMHNHNRNIQLFLDSDGITIFSRKLLQYDMGRQLLNTIVQKSTQAILLLRETNVFHNLRDMLNTYGPYSQIGQWATIILYHFNSQITGSDKQVAAQANKSLQKLSDVTYTKDPNKYELDDTVTLFQNVIREIVNWKSQNEFNLKKPNFPRDGSINSELHTKRWTKNEKRFETDHYPTKFKNISNFKKELSFSFLTDQKLQEPTNYNHMTRERSHILSKFTKVNNVSTQTQTKYNLKNQCDGTRSQLEVTDLFVTNTNECDKQSEKFKPIFVSTPRHKQQRINNTNLNLTQSTIQKSSIKNDTKCKVNKLNRVYKQKNISKSISSIKETRNNSLRAKIFSVINDSCTTIVRSVKNIFKTKYNGNNKQINDEVNPNNTNSMQCSYSFTNYMRKRDAQLANECSRLIKTNCNNTSIDLKLNNVNPCKTCDDTIILEHKLAKDEYLKRTVKKLKMGVHLYGCDFKKISKAMFPREKFMTPNNLYTLYKKLIVK